MRPTWRAIVCAAAVGLAATAARAELFSKAYAFKANTVLQVGAEIGAGLRLDSIEWIVTQDDGSPSGLFSGPHVKVAISNVGSASAKVAIAAAVERPTPGNACSPSRVSGKDPRLEINRAALRRFRPRA